MFARLLAVAFSGGLFLMVLWCGIMEGAPWTFDVVLLCALALAASLTFAHEELR